MRENISVVIPVKGRLNYLKKLLESLNVANLNEVNEIEINVIDSSTTEEEQNQIRDLCHNMHSNYYFIEGGISKARNHGISVSTHSIILFTDSDCQVESNIFIEHLKCYDDDKVGGCIGITQFIGKRTRLWKIIEQMSFLSPFQWAEKKEKVSWGPCSNISYKKECLEEVKGFNSIISPKEAGEDVDIGYRITKLGYNIVCNSEAIVYHTRETWSKFTEFIEKTYRFGKGEYYLMKKHPEKTFVDVPKNFFIFIILSILFLIKAFINWNFLLLIIPFSWLLGILFLQSIIALKIKSVKGKWKDIGYLYSSLLFELIFEIGTIYHCIRNGSIKLLIRRFYYTRDQLFGRWYWGLIRMWSFIISLFILLVILLLI